MANEPFWMHAKCGTILFRYWATPLSNNKTPAEMYLKCNIHFQLAAIWPMKHVQNTNHAAKSRQLGVGERVQTQCYIKNQAVWKVGTIIQKFGKLHYQVKLYDGYIFKRHVNQFRKMEIPTRSHLHQVWNQRRMTIQPANRWLFDFPG
jgi:hypothetical protein